MEKLKEMLVSSEMPSQFVYEGMTFKRNKFSSIKGNAKVEYTSKNKIMTVFYTMNKLRNFTYADIKSINNIIIH